VSGLSATQVKMVTGPRNSPAITGYPNGLPIGLWDMGGAYPIAQAVFEYGTKHTGLWCGISSLVAGAANDPGSSPTLRLNSLSHRGDLMPWDNPVKVWLPCLAIAKNQQIVDSNGNLQTAIVGGTTNSSGTSPTWQTLNDTYFNPLRLDGTIVWCLLQFVDAIIGPEGAPSAWSANLAVTAGQFLVWNNFTTFACAVTGGVTGTHQPTWPATGQVVQDGTVEWQMNEVPNPAQAFDASRAPLQNCLALIPRYPFTSLDLGVTLPSTQPPQNTGAWIECVYLHRNKLPTTRWDPGVSFPAGTMLLDSNGNLQISAKAGTTGTTQPVWSTQVGETTLDSSSTNDVNTSITWTMSEIYVELGCVVGGVFVPFQNPNPIVLPPPFSSPPTIYFQTGSAGQELWWPIFDASLLVYTTKLGPQAAELLDIQARMFNMESTIVSASCQGLNGVNAYAGANLTVVHWPVRASAYADLTAILNLIT